MSDLRIDFRLEGAVDLLRLLKSLEGLKDGPEGLAVVKIDRGVGTATGASETVIRLEPSERLLGLVSTRGTRKIDGRIGR